MDRRPPWLQIIVGLLLALCGVRGVAQYESLLLQLLFGLVVVAGLMDVWSGLRKRAAAARPSG